MMIVRLFHYTIINNHHTCATLEAKKERSAGDANKVDAQIHCDGSVCMCVCVCVLERERERERVRESEWVGEKERET